MAAERSTDDVSEAVVGVILRLGACDGQCNKIVSCPRAADTPPHRHTRSSHAATVVL